jgi:hypothetical protein
MLSALFILGGCVKDDRSACPPLKKDFEFIYSPKGDGTNEFGNRIKDMSIYVFDQKTGVLVDIIKVSKEDLANGTMKNTLPDGNYTFVSWAGGGPDLTQGGFHGGTATGNNTGAYPPATIGQTTLGDFRMMLDTNPPATPGGYVTPKVPQFDDLYYGSSNVTIQNGKPTAPVNMNFTKNSTNLQVDLSGLENLPAGTVPRIFVTGRNGVLTSNDALDPNAPTVRYDPYSQTVSGNTETALIKTLRLDMSRSSDMPVMLYVQDAAGNNLVAPINLIDTIRNMRDANGNQPYQTQAAIDREDLFRIALAIQPRQPSSTDALLTVRVVINGFQPTPLGTTSEVSPR